MKKTFTYFILGTIFLSGLIGCLPKDKNTYDGPSLVEFKNHTLAVNPTSLVTAGIVTSPASQAQTDSSRYILINTRVTDTIYVQLVGPQQSTAIDIPFIVRPTSNSATVTVATEGTHYNLVPAGTRKVTIPANSSVGYILVRPVANSLPTAGDLRRVIFDLDPAGPLKTSFNYKSFYLTLKR